MKAASELEFRSIKRRELDSKRNFAIGKSAMPIYQCLRDRDAGKVKHCYANDKRWRDVYSGEL